MSRISQSILLRAIVAVQKMNSDRKERLADEIFLSQPHMLGSVLVLARLGVSTLKIEPALDTLFLCFQAMRESGLNWPLITEEELERQLLYTNAIIKFYASFDDESPRNSSVQQYVDNHTEKELLAWVVTKCRDWLQTVAPEETDKYVLQVAVNLVNCVASVPL
jgi:hypothetical protein